MGSTHARDQAKPPQQPYHHPTRALRYSGTTIQIQRAFRQNRVHPVQRRYPPVPVNTHTRQVVYLRTAGFQRHLNTIYKSNPKRLLGATPYWCAHPFEPANTYQRKSIHQPPKGGAIAFQCRSQNSSTLSRDERSIWQALRLSLRPHSNYNTRTALWLNWIECPSSEFLGPASA